MKILVMLIFMCGFISGALAQEWLVSDQPMTTPSPYTVPQGVTQFEFGVKGVSMSTNDMSWNYPQILMRAGLTSAFELRLGVPGYTTTEGDELHVTRFNDLDLEAKIQIGGKNTLVPGCLLVFTSLPTSPTNIDSGYVKVGAKYAGGIFNDIARAGWSLGAYSAEFNGEQQTYTTYSFNIGLNVVSRILWFVEFYGTSAVDEEWQPMIDTGLLVRIAPSAEFNIYWGAGLTDTTPDFVTGIGFAYAL